MEFETLKEALDELIGLCDSKEITTAEGEAISFNDLQDLYQERIYALTDLIGMSELYLKPINKDFNQ